MNPHMDRCQTCQRALNDNKPTELCRIGRLTMELVKDFDPPEFDTSVTLRCPCGKRVAVGFRRDDPNTRSMVHEGDACADFEEAERPSDVCGKEEWQRVNPWARRVVLS